MTAPSQPRANDPPPVQPIPTTPVIIINPDDEEGGNEPPVVTRPPPQMTFSAINGGNTHYGAGMDIEYVVIVRDSRIGTLTKCLSQLAIMTLPLITLPHPNIF